MAHFKKQSKIIFIWDIQCDQMVRLFIPYLAIYNQENLSINIKMNKVGSINDNYWINSQKIAKYN